MSEMDIPALTIVGMEGLFGCLALFGCILPIAQARANPATLVASLSGCRAVISVKGSASSAYESVRSCRWPRALGQLPSCSRPVFRAHMDGCIQSFTVAFCCCSSCRARRAAGCGRTASSRGT